MAFVSLDLLFVAAVTGSVSFAAALVAIRLCRRSDRLIIAALITAAYLGMCVFWSMAIYPSLAPLRQPEFIIYVGSLIGLPLVIVADLTARIWRSYTQSKRPGFRVIMKGHKEG